MQPPAMRSPRHPLGVLLRLGENLRSSRHYRTFEILHRAQTKPRRRRPRPAHFKAHVRPGNSIFKHIDPEPNFGHDGGAHGELWRICEGTPLKVEYIGEWEHPRNQKMLRFTLR